MIAASDIRVVPKTDDATLTPGLLLHLSDLRGFKIADPAPDIRGWKVELPDHRKAGSVEDLIVDTSSRSVRYVEVKADHAAIGTEDDEWLLIPVQRAQVDDREKRVLVDRLPTEGLAAAPRFPRGVPNKSQEQQVQQYYGVDIMGELVRDESPARTDTVV